jgi:hypothetical protein
MPENSCAERLAKHISDRGDVSPSGWEYPTSSNFAYFYGAPLNREDMEEKEQKDEHCGRKEKSV